MSVLAVVKSSKACWPRGLALSSFDHFGQIMSNETTLATSPSASPLCRCSEYITLQHQQSILGHSKRASSASVEIIMSYSYSRRSVLCAICALVSTAIKSEAYSIGPGSYEWITDCAHR